VRKPKTVISMIKSVISPHEYAEAQALHTELLAVNIEATKAIGHGAWSGNQDANERFTKAHDRSSVIVRRLKEITGAKGYPYD
jgi:hypothetical protein